MVLFCDGWYCMPSYVKTYETPDAMERAFHIFQSNKAKIEEMNAKEGKYHVKSSMYHLSYAMSSYHQLRWCSMFRVILMM